MVGANDVEEANGHSDATQPSYTVGQLNGGEFSLAACICDTVKLSKPAFVAMVCRVASPILCKLMASRASSE